jgi:hypothetical protein
MISILIHAINRWVCTHKHKVKKRKPIEGSDLYHLYTECLDCGYESPGVDTGGFQYPVAMA